MRNDSKSLAMAVLGCTVLAGPAFAQVRDPAGDSPGRCADIVQGDIRADSQRLTITLDLAGSPCPGARYRFEIDSDLDGRADVTLETRLDAGGHPSTEGPDGVIGEVDGQRNRLVWQAPLASLEREGDPNPRQIAAWFRTMRREGGDRLPDEVGGSIPFDFTGIASAVIGPGGGAVEVQGEKSLLEGASIAIPAGALGRLVTVSFHEALNPPAFATGGSPISPGRLEPTGLILARPATLTLPYRDSDLDSASSLGEDTVSLFHHSSAEGWVGRETGSRDPEAKLVSASVSSLGDFALRDASVVPFCLQPNPNFLPVLLVHGWQIGCGTGNSSTWGQLPTLLCSQGLDVFAMNYNTADSIVTHAVALSAAIDIVVHDTTRAGRLPAGVNLVAHSMGGLVARQAIERASNPEARVYRLLTAATPHLGATAPSTLSCTSPVIGCTAFREMSACSELLEGANGLNPGVRPPAKPRDLLACRGDYTFYGANDDGIVNPLSAIGDQWAADCNCGTFGGPAVFTPASMNPLDISRHLVGTKDPGIPFCGDLSRPGIIGCGRWGNLQCDHSSALDLCPGVGIVDVATDYHVMWPRIRDLALDAPWWAFPDDDFGDNCLNRRLWDVTIVPPRVGTAVETNQQLEMLKVVDGFGYLGLATKCSVAGDFDVQVDYRLLTWPLRSYHVVRFAAQGLTPQPFGHVGIYRSSYTDEIYEFRADTIINTTTSATAGTMRLIRTGSVVSGYADSVLIGSATTSTNATRFVLDLARNAMSPPTPVGRVHIDFDNFKVNSGTLVCPP